jgi:metal-responsive CopG/Arc/MetJ family transcriptional regulator
MATVSFSVPDHVKEAFNAADQGQNKSAVIADLMREAIKRAERKQRSHEAILRIMDRRKHAPAISNDEREKTVVRDISD